MRGSRLRRNFAHFARAYTKRITDTEWRWLSEVVDLSGFGIAIALEAPKLWQAAEQAWVPWRMSADELKTLAHRRPLSDRDHSLHGTLRERTLPPPLAALADCMLELGEKGKQESLFW